MLLLRALKNLISSISCTKKLNVGIELVMFVSLTEITADQVKKKEEDLPPRLPNKLDKGCFQARGLTQTAFNFAIGYLRSIKFIIGSDA